jgi:hypothetical protein
MLDRIRRLGLLPLALCAAIPLTQPSAARACSMCRCGDPTFNAFGTDVYADGKLRLALDWQRYDKEQGVAGHHDEVPGEEHDGLRPATAHHEVAGRESAVEDRLTATLSYAFADRLNLVARLPFSSHRIDEPGHDGETRETARGLADPEVYAFLQLWSSQFEGGLGRRAWISALAGVKTPWGQNDQEEDGVRLDEHLQSGSGSTDPFGGLAAFYLLDERSSVYGSLQHRWTGSNDFGYRYGAQTFANFGYERKLGRLLDGAVELNYRDADQDRIGSDGDLDPNTGGSVLYATPRLMLDLGRGWVGRLSVQVPVAKDLQGDQTERSVANLGFTYLF